MSAGPGSPAVRGLPKLCGLDAELGNFIIGLERRWGSGYEAARALLMEIEGIPGDSTGALPGCGCADCASRRGGTRSPSSAACSGSGGWGAWGREYGGGDVYAANPQDWGRRFLPGNGGCAYIDLDHLELCIPEVLSAWDHVASWHAMLRIARRALRRADARLPDGQALRVLVNNSDGEGSSYGSHLSFLVTRRAWENLFDRRLQYQLVLAAYQVSSIVFTGQGKVGSENRAPHVPFQLSQRADFFERLSGVQTTYNRPIVNSRDESLCGPASLPAAGTAADGAGMARLHVIFYDSNLCQVASLLKVGVLQIVLAMIEAEQVDIGLILEDPLDALRRWSHDPTLNARARTCAGREWTATELQCAFLEGAKAFVARGGADGLVPRAPEILALWEGTLLQLRARDFGALARRLDWALKLSILERVMRQRPTLRWSGPEAKLLDHVYSSLDPAEGLYWSCERDGLVERVVTEEEIARAMHEPPADTRAWTRAMLLRRAGRQGVAAVDWDSIRFTLRTGPDAWERAHRTLVMPDPTALGRTAAEAILSSGDGDLSQVLDRLETPVVGVP
jgi:proteasome accessory factor A